MFRVAATYLRPSVQISRRNFVSTVLLTRNWENETAATLKKEAKNRGISSKGNKATLVTRLQEFEARERPQPPPPNVQQVRHNSVTAESPETEVPGIPSSSEPPTLSPSFPKEFLDVKIPDASTPIPEPPIQIPFVPDFWDSSRVKAESAPPELEEPTSPSFIAVAGDATHISASPTYSDFAEADPVEGSATTSANQTFFQDVAEDLLFTASVKLPKIRQPKPVAEDVAEITTSSGSEQTDYSRTLDDDERRGVWIFLGLFTGSWLVAGFLKPSSALSEDSKENQKDVPESAHKKH